MTPIRRLALRLLRAEGYGAAQIAETMNLSQTKVPPRVAYDDIRRVVMEEVGAPASNGALFGELLAAADRYLSNLPSVAALRRSPPKGRQAKAA